MTRNTLRLLWTAIARRIDLLRYFRSSLVADSTIRVLAVGMALASLFALGSTLLIRDQETKRLLGHLDELLSAVESTARVACFVGDKALAEDVAKGLLTNRLVAGVKITAGNNILAEAARPESDGVAANHVVRHLIVSPFNAHELVGMIELIADNHTIQAQAESYSIVSAIVLVLEVVAVAGAVAFVMMRTVVRPIRIFSRRTRAIDIHSGEPVMAPEGNADNEIGLLAMDFNRMIGAMNTLLAAEQEMRKEVALSERRFRTLVENSPDIIMRFDRECRRIFINPAYTRQTGFSAEQVLGTGLENSAIWRPSMPIDEFGRRLRQVMETGAPDLILLEWPCTDGRMASHELYVVAEYDASGEVIGALAMARDVSLRMEAERQLLHLASFDPLTGMPNRRMFSVRLRDEIARADRSRKCLALLFLDLDRFKEVNDTLGHDSGDRLLVDAARRIRHCVRESDMVARLGGDEFVAILPDIGEAAHLARIAQDILSRLTQPFSLDGQTVHISASIGIACYPTDSESQENLLGCADQAMYAAKAQGRNGFSFFTRDMQEQAQNRMSLINDLHEALRKNQFEVWFQPIVEVATGRIAKAEALLRWRHPSRGMVPPNRFIPMAEETGAIHEIGDWVFRESARFASRWGQIDTGDGGKPRVSVNISPRQFTRGRIEVSWIDYLDDIGIGGECMEIEITEGLLLQDTHDIMDKLERFRSAGLKLSLDDFGTGHSAMAYLKKFNINYLKIDRSFIRDLETDLNDRAIAEAIIVMAHRLGLQVIAEGVENTGQRDLLAAAGCEYIQGYLYARPMPQEEFLAWIGELAVDATFSAERPLSQGFIPRRSPPPASTPPTHHGSCAGSS